jgi:uncharacterized protein DUF4384
MILALLAVLSSPPPTAMARVDDPPIRITLNSGGYYERGDRAKVHLRLSQDGYVIVLRADADGRVRVLFPLDPGDDNFVRGGRDYELPGRGGRETFFVDDRSGAGTVLAARSDDPFSFDRFTRGDHWDYRVLASTQMSQDPEAGLLDLVTAMADSGHFDYDVVGYSVDGAERYSYRRIGYGPSLRIGMYYGSRYRCGYYDAYYDPFYCDPFYYDPFYYDPFFYDQGYYRPYGYSCFGDPFCFSYRRIYAYGPGRSTTGGFVFKRPAAPPPLVLPRDRFPRTPARFGDRTPVVATGREVDRRPDITPPRRRESEPSAKPSRPSESGGRTWSEPRSSTSSRGSGSSSRPSTSSRGSGSGSSSRPSTSSRGSGSGSRSSGSKPSNSGTRRH